MASTLSERGKVTEALRKAEERFNATRRRTRMKKKTTSVSLRVMAEAQADITDLRLCEDYLRRKENGTLKTLSWEETRRRLGSVNV